MTDEPFDWKHPRYAPVIKERHRRLLTIRSDPDTYIPALKRVYRDEPWKFINDWGITFDPRNVERGLPAAIPFLLFPRQIEWVKWLLERWHAQEAGVTDKSRDLGLSWLSVTTACTLSLFYPGFTAGFGSRKEEYVDKIGSPKSLFWKARKFLEYVPSEFRAGHVPGAHAPHMRLLFPGTNATITGEAGDSIGRGDRASIYFVDEAAHLERPELIDASLSATTNCRIDISSANGTANPFAVKRFSYPEKQVFTLHWRDDPRKDDAWYEKQRNFLDPVVLAQEVDIDYSASVTGVVLPSVWVQAMVDAHVALGLTDTGERRATLDIADEGADQNAFASGKGIVLDRLEEWSGVGSDIFHTVVRTFGLCDELELTEFQYDADGMGAGVRGDARRINEERKGDGLRKVYVPRLVTATPFWGSGAVERPDSPIALGANRTNGDYYQNYKAQCWGNLQQRARETYRARTEVGYKYDPAMIVSISSALPARLRTRLIAELSQPTWGPNTVGKMVVDKKPDGQKSPNLADVVMMLFGSARRPMRINPTALRRR